MQAHSLIRRVGLLFIALIVAELLLLLRLQPARAAGVVGNGTPASCTESALNAALNGGGLVTFNCGSAPYTFHLSQALDITQTTTLDGGNLITLNGGGFTQILVAGFVASPTVTVKNITLTNGYTNQFFGGGAISNIGATLILHNTRILNSIADGLLGGGILNIGILTMTNSIVLNNHAYNDLQGGGGDGGGLYNGAGAATIINSTITNNHAYSDTNYANGFGGGIFNSASATLNLINSTVSGNFAYGNGGGIFNSGALSLYNATVTANQADADYNCTGPSGGTGGGLYNDGGTFTFQNTILAGNSDTLKSINFCVSHTNDCANLGAGTLVNYGYNLMQNYTGSGMYACTFINGAPPLADPVLGPLQNNGGPTPTHALLLGSPAIDGGDPEGCTDQNSSPLLTDQRGEPRPMINGTRCDIGAYEFGWRFLLPLIVR